VSHEQTTFDRQDVLDLRTSLRDVRTTLHTNESQAASPSPPATYRATAACWILDNRAALVGDVRGELAACLAVDDVGLPSMIDLVASQLELSLKRLASGFA
jgi:hypothetical protein